MKRLVFVTVVTAALAIAGCNKGNEDAVNNAALNQPNADQLNEIANQAAMDAANAQAAAQAKLQNSLQQENAAVDNAVNPQEADEQNVSGM